MTKRGRITGLAQPLDVCGCFRSISSRTAEFYEDHLDGFAPIRSPLFLKEVAEISREYSTLRSFQLCSLLGAPPRRWEHRLRDKYRSACFEFIYAVAAELVPVRPRRS